MLISASCSFSCNSISLTYYSSSFLFVPLGSTLATFHGNKLISETLHTKQMCINIKTLYIEGKYKVLVRERWYTSSCYVIKVRSVYVVSLFCSVPTAPVFITHLSALFPECHSLKGVFCLYTFSNSLLHIFLILLFFPLSFSLFFLSLHCV